ncbi:MAG TPA: hypothetical protein VGI39_21465 [Polyangiaceae bacterium]
MRTRARLSLAPFAASLLLATLAACSAAPTGDPAATGPADTLQTALKNTPPGDPGDPPDPPPKVCPAIRYDLHRYSANCQMPAAVSTGTWKLQYIYNDAPTGLRERFCAYTWTPNSNTSGCAPAPTGMVARASNEDLVYRGNCPLSNASCGEYVTQNGLPPPPPTTTVTCSGDLCTITQPSTGVGCCDACAEVFGHRAYVAIPQNTSVSSVSFSVDVAGGGSQLVEFYEPKSNIVAVDLDPNTPYSAEVIPQIHFTQ